MSIVRICENIHHIITTPQCTWFNLMTHRPFGVCRTKYRKRVVNPRHQIPQGQPVLTFYTIPQNILSREPSCDTLFCYSMQCTGCNSSIASVTQMPEDYFIGTWPIVWLTMCVCYEYMISFIKDCVLLFSGERFHQGRVFNSTNICDTVHMMSKKHDDANVISNIKTKHYTQTNIVQWMEYILLTYHTFIKLLFVTKLLLEMG